MQPKFGLLSRKEAAYFEIWLTECAILLHYSAGVCSKIKQIDLNVWPVGRHE